MDPNFIKYAAEAAKLIQAGLEIFNLAQATLSRMAQANAAPVTDEDLAALKAKREAALDRLRKSL